jgi:predicted transcriptional regulator
MVDFILHYWIEVLFGLVITAGSFVVKRTLTSFRQERANEKKEFLEGIQKEIRAEFERSNKKEIELQNEIKTLKSGLLSVQGRMFKSDCKKLLEEDHEITLEEYEEITRDHHAYNSLGGNHNGDQLYLLVRKKVENSWANRDINT